jgi:uncharacterized OB-fold protein
MSDTSVTDESTEQERLFAHRCPNDHLTVPGHPRCPTCGEPQTERIDLTDRTGSVLTWTEVASTPPGVREPNTLAIVVFTLDAGTVRVLGGTTDDITVGGEVHPVYVDQLRDPAASVREGTRQPWDGFRFEPC